MVFRRILIVLIIANTNNPIQFWVMEQSPLTSLFPRQRSSSNRHPRIINSFRSFPVTPVSLFSFPDEEADGNADGGDAVERSGFPGFELGGGHLSGGHGGPEGWGHCFFEEHFFVGFFFLQLTHKIRLVK